MVKPATRTPLPATRLAEIEPFLAMEVFERAIEMERGGARVLHLEVGEPDFDAPPQVVEACARALHEGRTKYTDSRGTIALREAIAADLYRRWGASVDPARILVTMGTSPAMLLSFQTLLNPGDEVIIGTPHYPCYPNFVRLCGGVPVFIATDPTDRYRFDPDAVRAALTPRTRAIITSSPANPTGAIQPRAVLEALAGLGPVLISDEIYDGLVYDDARVTSLLELSNDAFVLDGFSKRYAMTGFRLGWVVAPEWAVRSLQVMQQSLFISANDFVQQAGIAALEYGADAVRSMRETYRSRRTRLVEGLRAVGLGVPHSPQGALYVLADARRFCGPASSLAGSRELAFELLERAHVGVTPGADFGAAAEGWLRFSFAVSEATIDEALERLEPVLRDLQVADADASSPGGAAPRVIGGGVGT